MINRIYEQLKKIIKENYKSLLTIILIYVVLMWPVDYYITTGGGTINIKNRVEVAESYPVEGSMNLAYVSELKGNVATYLLSYIMPNWERVDASMYRIDEEEDSESVDFRNRLELNESIDAAIKVAYLKAGKTFSISEEHIYIVYVDDKSKSKLKVGDELLSVENKPIKDLEELKQLINTHQAGDKVKVKVKRKDKVLEIDAPIYVENKQKIIGISLSKSFEYKTDPQIKLYFKESESGPSGGMMLSLDIYNKLTEEDLTKGYKIVGTGTINEKGQIGEIGGVKYKLLGAVLEKADIFLVPQGDNYKEAVKEAKKNDYKIKIIGAKTFDQALESLEELPAKDKQKS